jgi:tetratricopeptide (TPR) repeat protein
MSIEESIRAEIRRSGRVSPETLGRIDAALGEYPSAELWILRGDAIQLSDGDTHSLLDVEQSYERAIEFDPSSWQAYEALGHFHYAVMDDASQAVAFFERALDLGGKESARDGLRQALEEMRDRAFE